MPTFDQIEGSANVAVPVGGSVTVPYPSGRSAGNYARASATLLVRDFGTIYSQDAGDISVSFGASSVTVTLVDTPRLPAGTKFSVGLAVAELNIDMVGPVVAASDFGVRVNTGIAQTAALALAIAFLSPIGGTLQYDPGEVIIDRQALGGVGQKLSMTFLGHRNSNVGSDLENDISGTVLTLADNAAGAMFDVAETSGAFHWRDITFFGNQDTQSNDDAVAIWFRDAVTAGRSGTMTRCRWERFRGGAVKIGNGRNAWQIHECVGLNCGYDTNGSILNGTGKDILLIGANSDGRIRDSDFGSGSRNGVYVIAGGTVEISNTNSFSNEGRGVRIDGTAGDVLWMGGKIDRNKMDGALVTGCDDIARGYKRMFIGVKFEANSFDSNDTYHDIRALNCRGDLVITSPQFNGTGATANKPKYNIFADGTTTDLILNGYVEHGSTPTYATAFTNDESRITRGPAPVKPDGFMLSNNATDATNDIDVSAGHMADDSRLLPLKTSATIVKQLDVEFAEYTTPGTASGGRDAADNLTGGKWFHCWMIAGFGKPAQPFFSTSYTPTLPTGFTRKRMRGSVYWTGSTIKAFTHQPGDKFIWTVPQTDLSVGTWDTTARSQVLLAPLGRKTDAVITFSFIPTAGTGYARVEDPATTSAAVTVNSAMVGSVNGSFNGSGTAVVMTNTSSQVRHIANAAGTGTIRTLGWIDYI